MNAANMSSNNEKEEKKKKNKNKSQGDNKNDNNTTTKAALQSALTEIDDLFAGAKQAKKREKEESVGESTEEASISKPKKKRKKESDHEQEMEHDLPHGLIKSNVTRVIINPEAPVERIDKESGYKVYKAHLLKVGEGGGTPLCPFDCDCCF